MRGLSGLLHNTQNVSETRMRIGDEPFEVDAGNFALNGDPVPIAQPVVVNEGTNRPIVRQRRADV